MYQDGRKCCKIIFQCKTEMINILTEFETRGNLVHLKPDKKFLIEKNIKYKFIVNTKDNPIPHDKVFPIDSKDVVDVPRKIFADIEVDSGGDINFPSGDNAIHPVISISYVLWNGKIVWTVLHPEERKDEIWKTENENPLLNNLDVHVKFFKSEIDLLHYFGEIQREYQSYIVAGWNFLRFDIYYLIGRCKELNIPPEVLSISHWIKYKKHFDTEGKDVVKVFTNQSYFIDVMEAFIRFYQEKFKHNDLDYIAKEILGLRKIELNEPIRKVYSSDLKKFMNYNVTDSLLVKMIDEKTGMFEFYETRRKRRGISISDVFKTIIPIDSSLLYFAEKEKIALPDVRISNEKDTLKGALVYTDNMKILEYAGMFDFKAEYGSIAASLNCSPRTKVKKEKLYKKLSEAYKEYKDSSFKNKPVILEGYTYSPGKGKPIFFENKKDCFERKFLMDVFVNREKYFKIKYQYKKDSKEYKLFDIFEQDIKLDGNGLYGAWKNKYFRLCDVDCSQAITGIGRIILENTRSFFNSINSNVGLSDTDSADCEILEKTPENAVKRGYELQSLLENETNNFVQKNFLFGKKNGYTNGFDPEQENVDTHWIFAKFEKLFNPMIITGKKKHYAYRLIWQDGKYLEKPKYTIKGFECVQRNVSPVLKEAQQEIIYEILDRKIKNSNDLILIVKNYKKKLKNIDIDLIAMTGGYKNEVSSYKNVEKGYLPPLNAQAMCNSIQNFKITFEPQSRFKVIKVIKKKITKEMILEKKLDSKKYNQTEIYLNGLSIHFKQDVVAYNNKKELPEDFFDYFSIDSNFYFNDLILKKNEVFLEMFNVNAIVFSNQTQLTNFGGNNN